MFKRVINSMDSKSSKKVHSKLSMESNRIPLVCSYSLDALHASLNGEI